MFPLFSRLMMPAFSRLLLHPPAGPSALPASDRPTLVPAGPSAGPASGSLPLPHLHITKEGS
jgi:hypothetical protein